MSSVAPAWRRSSTLIADLLSDRPPDGGTRAPRLWRHRFRARRAAPQRSSAYVQRFANAQPAGAVPGIGGLPGIATSGASSASVRRGSALSRPIVYGCDGAAKIDSAGAYSTVRPAYMTITSSARPATTPMSWVISTIAVPRSRFSSRSRSMICACTVTSSAVVGSSAIRISGSDSSAIAIITRWRMPPENSCGYMRMRRAASGIRTDSSASIARFVASLRDSLRCSCSVSVIWRSIVRNGLSDVIGSWKIIAIRSPRILFSARESISRRLSPR